MTTLPMRFWARVDKTDGCWLWTGGKLHFGYGAYWVNGRNERAHRALWESMNGPIPEGKILRHNCDVPACVNPKHLSLGTYADNMQDKSQRGRCNAASGERHGHARLTNEDVLKIRQAIANGVQQKVLAKEYGVHLNTIGRISTGKHWGVQC